MTDLKNNCKLCANSCLVVSENGEHYNCLLSPEKAMKCLTQKIDYFIGFRGTDNG